MGVGVAITASIFASGNVGWVPLGPGEPYYPSYHVNQDYLQRINRVDVRNYTQINIHNTVVINNYVNRRAAIYVPGSAMARGEPVAHYSHPVDDKMFAQARPVQGEEFNQALRPAVAYRAAPAPRPTDFAQRRSVPPAVISHEPVQFHTGSNGVTRSEMAPGYHPQAGEAALRPEGAPAYHPEASPGYHPEAAPAYRAPSEAYHPQAPVEAYHPQEPAYRPPAEAYRPQAPAEAYHPEQPAYHPEMGAPQYRPEAAPRPPEAGHANGGHDQKQH